MLVTILSRTTKNLIAEDTGGVMDDYGFDLTHDAKDRMTGWDRDTANTALDSQDWTLSFEANWDDSTLTDGGVDTTQTRTHDAAHQLLTLDPDGAGGVSALSQSHDPKGNLTADGQGIAITYDFDNMPRQVVVSSTSATGQEGTHEYQYDALGRRVAKTVDTNANGTPDQVTVFVYTGQQVIAEYRDGDTLTTPIRRFIFGGGYIDEPLAMIYRVPAGDDRTFFFHRNRQYSIIGLTNINGAVVEHYAYTAYGQLTVLAQDGTTVRAQSNFTNPYGYTGQRIDPETGLWYFRARHYDAQLGRFLQRDPLGYPDGMNGYAAYHLLWGDVDPLGLCSQSSDGNGKECICKSISVSFSNRGRWDAYSWTNLVGGETRRTTFLGNKIRVTYEIEGNPDNCQFFQDEAGSFLKAISSDARIPREGGNVPFPEEDSEDWEEGVTGRDGNRITRDGGGRSGAARTWREGLVVFEDHMGISQTILAGQTTHVWIELNAVSRCVSSDGNTLSKIGIGMGKFLFGWEVLTQIRISG